VESDYEMRDLRICGTLLVEGDLDVRGTGTVQGLALVGGDLTVADQGRFEGMARIGGSVTLEGSAAFLVSACPVLAALSGTPALLHPLLLTGPRGIPLYQAR